MVGLTPPTSGDVTISGRRFRDLRPDVGLGKQFRDMLAGPFLRSALEPGAVRDLLLRCIRSLRAIVGPKASTQRRMLSYVTTMPRSAEAPRHRGS